MKYIILILLSVISLSGMGQTFDPSVQGDFFVSPRGSDSNTGLDTANAFYSLDQAFVALTNRSADQDTIVLLGGVYYTNGPATMDLHYYQPYQGASGTYGNPIVIMGNPNDVQAGNRPIIDCIRHCDSMTPNASGDIYNRALDLNYVEHLYFKDFDIRNVFQCFSGGKDDSLVFSGAIASAGASNLTFENVNVYNIGQKGYYLRSGAWTLDDGVDPPHTYDTTRFINCDTYNLCDSFTILPGNHADAWKTTAYRGNYYYWENCRAWNYCDDGFDPGGSMPTRVFKNCWAMSSNKYATAEFPGTEGNGFKASEIAAGVSQSQRDQWDGKPLIIFENCLAVFNHSSGFYTGPESDSTGNPYYVSNTSMFNDINYYEHIHDDTIGNIFRNNITYGATGTGPSGRSSEAYITLSYYETYTNSFEWMENGSAPEWQWNPAFSIDSSDFDSVDSLTIVERFTAPRQADGSLPENKPLQLAASSDLIDGGSQVAPSDNVDITLTYSGTAPDLGYAEYTGTSLPTNNRFPFTRYKHNGRIIKHNGKIVIFKSQ